MTRIMRMRIPVLKGREWVSVIPCGDRPEVLVVRESGEELTIGIETDAPIEPQISKTLTALDAPEQVPQP